MTKLYHGTNVEFEFDESCLTDETSGCLYFDSYDEDWTAFVLKN